MNSPASYEVWAYWELELEGGGCESNAYDGWTLVRTDSKYNLLLVTYYTPAFIFAFIVIVTM